MSCPRRSGAAAGNSEPGLQQQRLPELSSPGRSLMLITPDQRPDIGSARTDKTLLHEKPFLKVAPPIPNRRWEAFIVPHALIQLAHYNVKLNDIITKLC